MTAWGVSFRDTISVRIAELPDRLFAQNSAGIGDIGLAWLGFLTWLRRPDAF
jgi:hypothetical protein